MKLFSRKAAVAASMLAGALFLSACGTSASTPEAPETDDTPTTEETVDEVLEIKYGAWQPGSPPAVSAMWAIFLEEDAELQEKYGIKFTNEKYTALDALYTDLAMGRVQGVSAAPTSMAAQASQGAPVRMASTSARSTAAILTTEGTEWSADALRGKRLVAPTSTGTWSDVQLAIKENLGLGPGDYELVSAQDLAGPVTQLAAGTADFAMTWGESIPNALAAYPNVVVAATPEDLAGDGKPPWQFSISVHESLGDEAVKRLAAAANEIVAWMLANPDAVEEKAVSMGQEEGIAYSMIVDGYQTFEFIPMNEDVKAELSAHFQKLVDMGRMEQLPPDSFFAIIE